MVWNGKMDGIHACILCIGILYLHADWLRWNCNCWWRKNEEWSRRMWSKKGAAAAAAGSTHDIIHIKHHQKWQWHKLRENCENACCLPQPQINCWKQLIKCTQRDAQSAMFVHTLNKDETIDCWMNLHQRNNFPTNFPATSEFFFVCHCWSSPSHHPHRAAFIRQAIHQLHYHLASCTKQIFSSEETTTATASIPNRRRRNASCAMAAQICPTVVPRWRFRVCHAKCCVCANLESEKCRQR